MNAVDDGQDKCDSASPIISLNNVGGEAAADLGGSEGAPGLLHMNDLPYDTLLCIFSFLSRQDRFKNAALVCAYWHDLIRYPYFWRKCNCNGQEKLNDVILQRVLRYSFNVESLDISNCPLVTDDGLIEVMDHCSSLQTLNIAR